MKKYQAIIFDWDGTAVVDRNAPVDQVLPLMRQLLDQGTRLAIISGTTYENIAQGQLHRLLPEPSLANLTMGLGRGAYTIGFHDGEPLRLQEVVPDLATRLRIHEVAFACHQMLLEQHGYETDIVFSRPNYCKVDLLVDLDRKERLFFSRGDLELVNRTLEGHDYRGGIRTLMDDALELGRQAGLNLKITTDAKYLEIGLTTKADSVDWLLANDIFQRGVAIEACAFWGDEFTLLGPGVLGSDAMMITELSQGADFFDVCERPLALPPEVVGVGGGVASFLQFLEEQISLGQTQPRRSETSVK